VSNDTTRLVPTKGMVFQSTKTYVHSVGLSCCFRQWRAKDSHCRYLHGYSLEVRLTFQAVPDERGWIQDFGGLKWVKTMLEEGFDHKLLVAQDDPYIGELKALDTFGLAQVVVVEHTGCEAFAKMIFDAVEVKIPNLYSVEVREHAGNSAIYKRQD
jgi:6-pyruvoyltetrahydropterin/6-carboxytetrahydropterin synthase